LKRFALIILSFLLLAAPVTKVGADVLVGPAGSGNFMDGSTNRGSADWEAKVTPISAYYQSGSTVYGGQSPFVAVGLMASLAGNSRVTFDWYYLGLLQTTVTITDSSGIALSGSSLADRDMLLSPNDSPGTDYSGIFFDLASLLIGIGLPSPLTLRNGLSTSGTGINVGSTSVTAQWSDNAKTLDKGLNFRFQPLFPHPDAYNIAVSNRAELWQSICGFIGCTFIRIATVTSNYSFTYVYENDANSNFDAGNTFGTALTIAPGTYNGFLYGADRQDWYQVYVAKGNTVSASLTGVPPMSGCQPTLQLYSPKGGLVASSFNCDFREALSARAKSSGYWRILIYLDTTVPKSTYTFSVSA
jgi:hypothetical protein